METDKNKDWTFVDQETGDIVDFKKIGTNEKVSEPIEVKRAKTLLTISKGKENVLRNIIDGMIKIELREEVFNLLIKDVQYVDDFIFFYSNHSYTKMFAVINYAKTK